MSLSFLVLPVSLSNISGAFNSLVRIIRVVGFQGRVVYRFNPLEGLPNKIFIFFYNKGRGLPKNCQHVRTVRKKDICTAC